MSTDPQDWTEEELEAWREERRQKRIEHQASLSPEVRTLAETAIARVHIALRDSSYGAGVGVTLAEFEAWEAWLLPAEHYTDSRLANAGVENLMCKGVPIFVDVDL